MLYLNMENSNRGIQYFPIGNIILIPTRGHDLNIFMYIGIWSINLVIRKNNIRG